MAVKPSSTQPVKSPDNGWGLAAVIGVVIVVILAIGNCGGNKASNSADTAYNTANADMSNAIAAQTPPAPAPLSAASVTRGMSHLRLAVTAEGFPGAMVYSQNCYDALSRDFSWTRLDQCGGFDMLAVRSIATADTAALVNEPGYFQSETAAGRYLAAATGASEPAPEADARLSQLQAQTARGRLVGQRPPPTPAQTGNSGIGDTVNDALEPMDDLEAGE